MSKVFKDSFVYTIFISLSQLLVILIVPFIGFIFPGVFLAFSGLIIGGLFMAYLMIYFKSLHLEEASAVIPLYGFVPLLVLVLSFVFIGESLEKSQLIAFIFLFLGSFILSVKKLSIQKIRFTSALKYVLSGTFLFAFILTLMKLYYLHVSFFEGFVLIQVGSGLGALLVLTFKKKLGYVKKTLIKMNIFVLLFFILNFSAALFSQYLLNKAISLGNVAIINAAQGIQYFLVFIFATSISIFLPSFMKEDLAWKNLFRKLIGILLILVGLIVLNLA